MCTMSSKTWNEPFDPTKSQIFDNIVKTIAKTFLNYNFFFFKLIVEKCFIFCMK